MANKLMGLLDVGNDTYEIADIKAREQLNDIEIISNTSQQSGFALSAGEHISIKRDNILNYRYFTLRFRNSASSLYRFTVLKIDKNMMSDGIIWVINHYLNDNSKGTVEAGFSATDTSKDTIEVYNNTNSLLELYIYGSNV